MKYTNENIVGKWFKTPLGRYYIVSYDKVNKRFTLSSEKNTKFNIIMDIAEDLNRPFGSWRIIDKLPIYEIY